MSDSNKLLLQSFLLDLAMWIPWVALTYAFKDSFQNSIIASFLSSLLFLAPRILRWISLAKIGNLVDSTTSKQSFLFTGCIILVTSLLISSVIRLSFIDFILVALRGFIQAIFDCTRPVILKSKLTDELTELNPNKLTNVIKEKSFELSLIPSLAMGVGSLLGGLLSTKFNLREIFSISFLISFIILAPTYFKHKYEINFQFFLSFLKKEKKPKNTMIFKQSIRNCFSQRFALATVFGGTPFLMHLKFNTLNGAENLNFSLFMCATSIGILMAIIMPKKVKLLTKYQLANVFFFLAWLFQILLLYFGISAISIVLLSISTVFFQFMYMGISVSKLLELSPQTQLGSILGLASKYEIGGAVVAHLIYGFGITYLLPMEAFFVSTIVALLGVGYFSLKYIPNKSENILSNEGLN